MKSLRLLACLILAASAVFLGSTFVGRSASKTVSIEGTYVVLSHTLADGTVMKAPDVTGSTTYTKDYRSLIITWVNKDGKRFSYCGIAKYKLTDKEYTSTLLFSETNDETGKILKKKGIVYGKSETKNEPVTVKDGKISIKLPFEVWTFNGNTLTVAVKGKFTDVWEKVK